MKIMTIGLSKCRPIFALKICQGHWWGSQCLQKNTSTLIANEKKALEEYEHKNLQALFAL